MSFVGINEFSVYDRYLIIINIFGILASLESYQAMTRMIKVGIERRNRKLFINTFLIISLGYILLALFFLIAWNEKLKETFQIRSPEILIASAYLYSIYNLIQQYFRFSLKNLKNFFVTTVFYSFISVTSALILSYIFKTGVAAIYGILIGALIVSAFFFLKEGLFDINDIDIKYIISIIKYSWPLVVSSLMLISVYYLDRFLLLNYFDDSEIGLYSYSVRIVGAVGFVIAGIQIIIIPFAFRAYSSIKFPEIMSYGLEIVFYLTFLLIQLIILFAAITKSFKFELYLVPLIFISTFLLRANFFAVAIFIKKKTNVIFFGNAIYLMVEIVVFYLTVKPFEIFSIYLANIAGAFVSFIYLMNVSQRLQKIYRSVPNVLFVFLLPIFESILIVNYHDQIVIICIGFLLVNILFLYYKFFKNKNNLYDLYAELM